MIQNKKIKQLRRFIDVHRSQIGRILLKKKVITKDILDKALALQAKNKKMLPNYALISQNGPSIFLKKPLSNKMKFTSFTGTSLPTSACTPGSLPTSSASTVRLIIMPTAWPSWPSSHTASSGAMIPAS